MSSKTRYPPVRPPRSSKVSKDTSGRLMNIIAELSVSNNNDDRKKKMLELKKDFHACDARLVQLISGHRDNLSSTMESFSQICAKINNSRRGCRQVKEKLIVCKQLLECKRDEIRRLYCESVEHREVVYMLKEINDLNDVRGKVEDFLKEKDFLHATELLVSALALMDGKLSGADALKDLKSEVNLLRKKLHRVLIEEIHKYLYMSPSNIFLCKNSESGGDLKCYDDTFIHEQLPIKLPVEGSFYDFSTDSNYKQIAVVLGCIALLQSLSETVEILKENCNQELLSIVKNSTEVMCSMMSSSAIYSCEKNQSFFSGNVQNQNGPSSEKYFLDLLIAILNQFRQVAVNHYVFWNNLERIAMTKGLTDITQYELADVYSKLQASIELFIGDYLDLHSAVNHQRAITAFTKLPSTDISSYFLRKTVTRTKKQPLFKFDGSSHAINKKTYLEEKETEKLKEKGEDSSETERSFLVCPPSAKNITVIYKTIRIFITDVETALEMEPGTHCPLYSFLMDCVKVFLDQVSIEINRLLERITLNLDSWNAVTDVDELRLVEAKTPVLNSTLSVHAYLLETEELINRVPDYSSNFLEFTCHVLESYKELCFGAYKSLISPVSDDQDIFSVMWSRDISEVLKSLPNWAKLTEYDQANNFEESPEEIRFRNKEENELLFRHLYNKDTIGLNEIISDYNKLRNIALMHESMEWFSSRILRFAEHLPDIQASLRSVREKYNEGDNDVNMEVSVGISTKITLKKLAEDFKDLADTCLLVIHLEIRAHCFYYLFSLCKEGSYVSRKEEEPEPEVMKLNTDITRIDETIGSVLQLKKMRYLFEGLGELLSIILINSVSNLKKINENKVKKMGRNIFAIQQNLAGITMTREVALDRARQYFDLLNHNYEDILNKIVEEGPQFQEYEYSAVIQLLHNSREGIYDQDSLSVYLEKLRQILDEVPVSV